MEKCERCGKYTGGISYEMNDKIYCSEECRYEDNKIILIDALPLSQLTALICDECGKFVFDGEGEAHIYCDLRNGKVVSAGEYDIIVTLLCDDCYKKAIE